MGRRLYIKRLIAQLCASYMAVFLLVLLAISGLAYAFVGSIYRGELEPALGTPQADLAYREAMRHVAVVLVAFDVPLVVLVGLASYVLARISIGPLVAAREREAAFAADAAHELRTPLASIGTLAAAAALDAPARERDAFERIARIARDAALLVGDLLTLMRADARLQLPAEPLDLGALLAVTAKEFEARARERAVRLEVPFSSAIVAGDETRLRQCLRNLFDNALRYARTRVVADIQATGDWVCLSVEDDGEGVPPAARGRVFERFFRAREDAGGSGLGLAICRWVAHAHRGAIELEGGSRFVLRLPRLRIDAPSGGEEPSRP